VGNFSAKVVIFVETASIFAEKFTQTITE